MWRAWLRFGRPARERGGGVTLNRLCGSGLDAVGTATRAIKAGEQHLLIAGGMESMSRAPFCDRQGQTALFRAASP